MLPPLGSIKKTNYYVDDLCFITDTYRKDDVNRVFADTTQYVNIYFLISI